MTNMKYNFGIDIEAECGQYKILVTKSGKGYISKLKDKESETVYGTTVTDSVHKLLKVLNLTESLKK